MKIRYTDRTPQDITKHKVQKDWASAIKVLKPFKTGSSCHEFLVLQQYECFQWCFFLVINIYHQLEDCYSPRCLEEYSLTELSRQQLSLCTRFAQEWYCLYKRKSMLYVQRQ